MAETLRVAFLSELESEFKRNIARGAAMYADQHGPWTILWNFMIDISTAQPRRGVRTLADVDGILVPLRDAKTARRVRAARRPTVAVGGYETVGTTPAVMTDEPKIGRMVAEHFLSRGVRNFAYYDQESQTRMRGRLHAFCDAVEAAGHTVSVFNSHSGPITVRQWTEHNNTLIRWLTDLPKPVGLMAINDLIARDVFVACHEAGIRIPEDVAIIAVDNETPVCLFCDPPLSSVDHGAEQIGFEAARLLDCLMRGQTPPSTRIHVPPVRIIERQSSDLLAVEDSHVAAAVRYIREHIAESLRVSDVATGLAVSRSTLEKAFRRRLQRTIREEILRAQIARAKELLISTDLSMPRIAEQCGFTYPSRLSASFKRDTSLTCTAYRRQFRVT